MDLRMNFVDGWVLVARASEGFLQKKVKKIVAGSTIQESNSVTLKGFVEYEAFQQITMLYFCFQSINIQSHWQLASRLRLAISCFCQSLFVALFQEVFLPSVGILNIPDSLLNCSKGDHLPNYHWSCCSPPQFTKLHCGLVCWQRQMIFILSLALGLSAHATESLQVSML